MVVCSVAIHGLSIPGFSLGRRVHTVSMTISRHTTLNATPEWTNQIKGVIDKKKDPVDEMERGEKEVDITEVADGHSGSETSFTSRRSDSFSSEDSGSIKEWQEGPHRVIERRIGLGEEVGRVLDAYYILDINPSSSRSKLKLSETTEASIHHPQSSEGPRSPSQLSYIRTWTNSDPLSPMN
jgi:sodium/hydrogen antiporter